MFAGLSRCVNDFVSRRLSTAIFAILLRPYYSRDVVDINSLIRLDPCFTVRTDHVITPRERRTGRQYITRQQNNNRRHRYALSRCVVVVVVAVVVQLFCQSRSVLLFDRWRHVTHRKCPPVKAYSDFLTVYGTQAVTMATVGCL